MSESAPLASPLSLLSNKVPYLTAKKDVRNGKYRALFFTTEHPLLEESTCGIPHLPVAWFSLFKVVQP